MAAFLKLIFWLCLLATTVAWWNYDQFVMPMQVHPALDAEPVQEATRKKPFTVSSEGVTYQINPLFQYDLHGMVVSFRHHDGDSRLHRLWNDRLNVVDLCVVWGQNAKLPDLNAFDFWNGQFTCFVRTSSSEAWSQFNTDQLSNLHVLTDRPHLRDLINSVELGDQIHITGLLAEYGHDGASVRSSSTVRDDGGNGACETIYAESFSIIRPMDSAWRSLWVFAGVGTLLSAFLWLLGVGSGRLR